MLWYRIWCETRLRFLMGLGLLIVVAGGTVAGYPAARELAPLAQDLPITGAMGERIRESLALQASYRGYIWLRWYSDNLAQLGTLFAIILGSGTLVSDATGRSNPFTLSLPVSRNRLLGARAALGLAQWLAIVVFSSLVIPVLSPAVDEAYGLADTVVHASGIFLVGSMFFSLALLLSTIFKDLWRPLLITLAVTVVLAACEYVLWDVLPFGLIRVMTADAWYTSGRLPWPGFAVSIGLAGLMLYAAARLFARRDF